MSFLASFIFQCRDRAQRSDIKIKMKIKCIRFNIGIFFCKTYIDTKSNYHHHLSSDTLFHTISETSFDLINQMKCIVYFHRFYAYAYECKRNIVFRSVWANLFRLTDKKCVVCDVIAMISLSRWQSKILSWNCKFHAIKYSHETYCGGDWPSQ